MSATGADRMPPGHGPLGPPTKELVRAMMARSFKYRGITFNGPTPVENLEAMETFHVRDEDIFVVTYPKCGTHWTMEILYLILADGHLEKIDRKGRMDFGALEMNVAETGHQQPAHKAVESHPSPRILPTHLPESILPPSILKNTGKVVYVMRNPKDCLTSLFHFIDKIAGGVKFEGVFEKFLSDDMHSGNFFDFTLAYWKHRHDNNFLFVRFEDMKRDTRSAVVQIADHIGHPLTDEAVDRVVANCSLDRMKQSYQAADLEGVMPVFGAKGSESLGKFLRKGAVGDWKNSFTVAMNERFDQFCREKLTGSGLTFEFE